MDPSTGIGVEVVWPESQAERPVGENSHPHPNNVAWKRKELNTLEGKRTKYVEMMKLRIFVPAESKTLL
jgi:hypothetical protein